MRVNREPTFSSTIERCVAPPSNTCAQFSVGSARYRCLEPLFDPTILKGSDINASKISLAEAMYIAVSNGTDPSNRASLWEGVLLTGGYAKIKVSQSVTSDLAYPGY